MTLTQLESFLILAQRLNFTQAADDLFISQPALSRMISSLEQEVGLQLFYRSSRSVSLTPAGRAFAQQCPRILDSYRAGMEKVFGQGSCYVLTVRSCGGVKVEL